MVKISPSDAGDVGRFLVEKRKQYCNKFNKDFKNGPHKKKLKKKTHKNKRIFPVSGITGSKSKSI